MLIKIETGQMLTGFRRSTPRHKGWPTASIGSDRSRKNPKNHVSLTKTSPDACGGPCFPGDRDGSPLHGGHDLPRRQAAEFLGRIGVGGGDPVDHRLQSGFFLAAPADGFVCGAGAVYRGVYRFLSLSRLLDSVSRRPV